MANPLGTPGNLTNAGKGRPKGVPNKATTLLKDAILLAAQQAGGKEGLLGYLTQQAQENPQAFMSLLGKVLPMQITGENGDAIKFAGEIRLVGVRSEPSFEPLTYQPMDSVRPYADS